MTTQIDIQRFYNDVESLGLKFPVAELARVTGYSKGNVSDYLNKKKDPSEKFMASFYENFGSSIKVPREAILSPNKGVSDQSIYKMAESNMVLSEAHKALADAHYLLAKNNENLISLVIGSVGIGKSKADPPIPIAVLELLAEEATENNYKSKEEALAAFRRIAHGGLKKKKEAGIRQSSGK